MLCPNQYPCLPLLLNFFSLESLISNTFASTLFQRTMDAYEATSIVFSRVQALDPDNAAKIMGLLLIQDHGEKEMIRLAFGPETLLHSLILNTHKDLGLLSPSTPSTLSTNPSPSPFSLSCQNSRGPNSPSSWAPPPLPLSRTNDDGDGEEYLLQEHLSFLNEQAAAAAGDPVYGMSGGVGWEQTSCLSPDGFGWKPCLYFGRGFCKNESSCRFLRGPSDDMSAAAAAAAVEQQCQKLMLMRSQVPRLAASAAAAFPYSPTGSSYGKCLNFMLQQQQNERQRAAAAAAAALMLENENHKFMGRPRMDRGDFAGMVNPGSRQIYLTFPADSTFREEDVADHFCIYGPVQDVRIPYQQKRMFGFVTFVYPETVKLILAKGNPHFVCEARVLVKPYREKGKVNDKYRKQQQGERIDFSGCTTPTGLDSRDPYDLQQLASARMLYGSNGQDVPLRRKMEEQQAAAELPQAIEMQGRRFMGLQLLDIKNRNLASPTAPILSPLSTPASTTFGASVFSAGSSGNGSQEEAIAVEDKSRSPAASGTASAAADKHQTAVNSEERASAETAPNEDLSYQESAEHNLPDSPFASPAKKPSFVNDPFFLASEENSSLSSNGSSISNSNGHLIASTLLAPSSPLENMAPFKSSCFLHMPSFSSGHGAVGL